MNGSNLLELETLKWPLIKLEKGSSETYIRNSENRVPVFYIFFIIMMIIIVIGYYFFLHVKLFENDLIFMDFENDISCQQQTEEV